MNPRSGEMLVKIKKHESETCEAVTYWLFFILSFGKEKFNKKQKKLLFTQ